MSGWLENIVTWAAGGVSAGIGLGGGIWFVKWLIEWIGGRIERKAATVDASMHRLLDRLEGEVRDLRQRVSRTEADLAECKEQHAQSRAEILRLEALLQAQGGAREHAQLIIAAEKRETRK